MTKRFTTKNGVFYTDNLTGWEFQSYGEVVKLMNELSDENEELKRILQDCGLLMSDEEIINIRTKIADKLIKPLFKGNGFDVDVDCTDGFTIIPKNEVEKRMTENKRFQYNVNKNIIEQNGKFVAYMNSVDGARIANKLNELAEENDQLKQDKTNLHRAMGRDRVKYLEFRDRVFKKIDDYISQSEDDGTPVVEQMQKLKRELGE